MATLGVSNRSSDSAAARRRRFERTPQLIVVPRETPWNLIHARNVVTLLEAGAVVLPAIPHSTAGRRPSTLS
jgi:4-hydroxy-3-polyprenylbenzoate decarboxylase